MRFLKQSTRKTSIVILNMAFPLKYIFVFKAINLFPQFNRRAL